MSGTPTLRAWLSAEPFDLVMSSGFFGFYAHTGLLSVLEEEGLVPERLAGSSAGALVACASASGMTSDALMGELSRLRREHFWDPAPGPGLLRGALLRERLERILPVSDFEACARPVTVSAFDLLSRRTRTIREGSLARAIHASCAVPGMFHPVWIGGRPHVDGGLADRPGLHGVPPRRRILYHHLVSRLSFRRALPRRAGATILVMDDLPRVGPFQLGEGLRAMEVARRAARRALDRPIHRNGTIRVRAH